MRKKWLIESNAWIAPPRRTATTAAPTLRFRRSSLALATSPARSINALQVCEAVLLAGADLVTLHPRTAAQGFDGNADWDVIARASERFPGRIVGNGDVDAPRKARKMWEDTGCHAVMVARAALGNPWFIAQAQKVMEDPLVELDIPHRQEIIDTMIEHLDKEIALRGETPAVRYFRSWIGLYLKKMPFFTI